MQTVGCSPVLDVVTRVAPTPLIGASRYVEVDGNRLHLLDYGSVASPVIVIVPGITSAAAIWEFVAVDLATDFRVLTVDVRGRGLSDAGSKHATSDHARDLAEAICTLGLERPTVVGHSAGARIAATFGVSYPDLRGPLVLADPPLSGPGRPPYPTSLEEFIGWIRLARSGAARDLQPLFPTLTEEQLALRVAWLATCDEAAVTEVYRAFHEEDFFDSWRLLDARTLLLWGGVSAVVSREAARELTAANPAAEVACLPEAGHMLPWDDLAGFVTAIRQLHG